MAPTPEHLSTPETASFWAKTGDKESPRVASPSFSTCSMQAL